jgi:hypothetical protein
MIFYKFITNLLLNIKYTKLIKNVYKEDDLLNKLSKLFGSEFRMDWVGRIYTVINPNIVDNKLDINTQIFEYGETGLSNQIYVERYIMLKLNLIKDFVIANNLFDLLTYRIEKLDEYDNYLFVIEPITFEDCKKWTKIFGITYSSIAIILLIAYFIIW